MYAAQLNIIQNNLFDVFFNQIIWNNFLMIFNVKYAQSYLNSTIQQEDHSEKNKIFNHT